MRQQRAKEVLIISQVYVPDPAAVGQYLAELASGLTAQGHAVDVLTADKGYDDPGTVYRRSEVINGARIRRLRFSSFGKRSLLVRALGGLSFTLSTAFHAMLLRRVDAVVITTVPPAGILGALWVATVRRAALVYWVMDLNPDQAINLGLASPDSFMSKALRRLNEIAFRRADLLVVLDDFMERRIRDEYHLTRRVLVVPPWPHDEAMSTTSRAENRYRAENMVSDDQLVFMYAGNHAESAPVTTFLSAAEALKDDDRAVFFFVGGGRGKPGVEAFASEHGLSNVRCLPYQPLEDLGELLGAADVHLVTMGENLVGINHPCKIYGAMSAGRPILYVGPFPSHISVLIGENRAGWEARHGDVAGAVAAVRQALGSSPEDLDEMGQRGRQAVAEQYSKESLLGGLVEAIEGVL